MVLFNAHIRRVLVTIKIALKINMDILAVIT